MLEPEPGKDEGDRAITSMIRELVFPQTSLELATDWAASEMMGANQIIRFWRFSNCVPPHWFVHGGGLLTIVTGAATCWRTENGELG